MSTFPRAKCAPQPPVSPLSDSPGISGPPSPLQLQTPQRDKAITYAQAVSSTVPLCAPTRDTPSPTISSLSGASASTAARSAIMQIIKPVGSITSPQTTKSDGPPPAWQAAIANTMHMVTELLTHLQKPPRHHRRRPTNGTSVSSRGTKEENPQEQQGNSVQWRSGRKPQDRWRGRRGPRDERPKPQNNQEQHSRAPKGSVAPPTGRGPPIQKVSNDELDLLQLQEEMDEEKWIGTGMGWMRPHPTVRTPDKS